MINENLNMEITEAPNLTSSTEKGPGPELMGAHTLIGDNVVNQADEHLGSIKEIMLDMKTGHVTYAVVAHGGVLGIGEKLFAVPWSVLNLDAINKRFVMNIEKEHFENAPGFDSDHWPDMANPRWVDTVHHHYGLTT